MPRQLICVDFDEAAGYVAAIISPSGGSCPSDTHEVDVTIGLCLNPVPGNTGYPFVSVTGPSDAGCPQSDGSFGQPIFDPGALCVATDTFYDPPAVKSVLPSTMNQAGEWECGGNDVIVVTESS